MGTGCHFMKWLCMASQGIVRPLGVWLVAPLLAAGLFLTGCASPSASPSAADASAPSAPRSRPGLSDKEYDFARALARYGYGRIRESDPTLKPTGAIQEFEAARALDPDTQRLYDKIAVANVQLREPDRAIEVLQEACERFPKSSDAWINLGAMAQLCGRTNLAISAYGRAVELAPTNTAVYLELARQHIRQQRDAEAVDILRRAVKKAAAPNIVLAYGLAVGKEYIEARAAARAVPYLRFVADNVKSDRGRFLQRLAELYEAIGEEAEARSCYEAATKEDPPVPEPFVKLALMESRTDIAHGIRTLEEGTRRLPDDLRITFWLGFLYNANREFAKAIPCFERVKRASDEAAETLSAGFFLEYGSAHERLKQYDKAEAVFEEGIATYPDADDMLNYLAYMWAEHGTNLVKAAEYVNRALDIEPDNGAYADTLGWVYYQQKDYRKARAELERAAQLVDDDPTITEHLGDVYQALGETDRAVASWRRSLTLDPDNEAVAGKLTAAGATDVETLRREARQALEAKKAEKERAKGDKAREKTNR